ncbi:nuclear pore complex assembly-domain-containing protein [Rhexocercosporidium sp. MPI-PUGE-AT-0058]|nr:nuclear pore complex assembly-domain-containing protein [Rhexocercosporidium sp. MPI-PUGE-AT-0058]
MMFNFQSFAEVFAFDPECSYDENTVSSIEGNRKDLEGLFIDRVMKATGIMRPSKFYPPKSNNALRTLHKAIIESSGADHTKISVLYYLLLTFDFPTSKRDYSLALEQSTFLPQKYQIYMKGLWHMDRKEFESAVQYLTHPSLIPTFADEILEVLVRKSKEDLTLALAYYHTAQPTLTGRSAIECLFSAIARTSVTEAFYFARGQPQYAQRHMFEMLISVVLNNSPKETIGDRSLELVNLPLSLEEDGWLEEYVLHGDGRNLKRGRDTLMMRKIGTGNFTDSLSMRGINNRPIDHLDWSNLSEGIKHGLGPRLD